MSKSVSSVVSMRMPARAVMASLGFLLAVADAFAEMPTPVSRWSFEDADDLGKDSIGSFTFRTTNSV